MRILIATVGTLAGGGLLYLGATHLLGIVGKELWMSIALFSAFRNRRGISAFYAEGFKGRLATARRRYTDGVV